MQLTHVQSDTDMYRRTQQHLRVTDKENNICNTLQVHAGYQQVSNFTNLLCSKVPATVITDAWTFCDRWCASWDPKIW